MKRILDSVRRFFTSMGLVEQAQVVASTAVVVAMVTIVTSRVALGQNLSTLDFLSVVTVGVIGYVGIFFSLKYGRTLEEQRRELLELNTITEAVNGSVELNFVLQAALVKVMELMHADRGWIYLNENSLLELRHQYLTTTPLFAEGRSVEDPQLSWIRTPALLKTSDPAVAGSIAAA